MQGPFNQTFVVLIFLSIVPVTGRPELRRISNVPARAPLIQCCYSIPPNDASCSDYCTGERCVTFMSPGGQERRECVNGTDPATSSTGHRSTPEKERAFICDDRNFCNDGNSPPSKSTCWTPWNLGFVVAIAAGAISN